MEDDAITLENSTEGVPEMPLITGEQLDQCPEEADDNLTSPIEMI